MKFKLIFKWFDFWIGFFWDRKERILYFFPVPMFGMMITFPPKITYEVGMVDDDFIRNEHTLLIKANGKITNRYKLKEF